MTTKRLLLFASLPLTIAVTLGVLAILPAMLPHRPGVTKANFDRIQIGMTKAQVAEIFGETQPKSAKEGVVDWVLVTDDGSMAVIGFFDDCVTDKTLNDSPETFLDKIRRLLHLQ